MSAAAPPPMMRHYLEVKARYADCLVLYRCGDFYETFYEDALIAAERLDLTLTARDKQGDAPIPMAGFPHTQIDAYVARLVAQGVKVAVVEQTEDAKNAKGMIRREVKRVVTPALVIDDALLEPGVARRLAALYAGPDDDLSRGCGIAALDLSAGELTLTFAAHPQALAAELQRLAPHEVLMPADVGLKPVPRPGPLYDFVRAELPDAPVSARPEAEFDAAGAERRVLAAAGAATLDAFGAGPLELSAAGGALGYVAYTQPDAAALLLRIRRRIADGRLVLDATARRALEVFAAADTGQKHGSLLGAVDRTVTAAGERLLRAFLSDAPTAPDEIEARSALVLTLLDAGGVRAALRDRLKRTIDIERAATRAAMGRTTPRELRALGDTLCALPAVAADLDRVAAAGTAGADVRTLVPGDHTALGDVLVRAIRPDAPAGIRDGGIIADGFDAERDELARMGENAEGALADLERTLREESGIASLRIVFNRVSGYAVELTNAQKARAPARWIRRQTLANGERFTTPELKTYEDRVLTAKERLRAVEAALFERLRDEVARAAPPLRTTAEALARLDVFAALAELAHENAWVRPEITTAPVLEIVDGRHPVLERLDGAERFVPNDVLMGEAHGTLHVVTGPNMAGKSTVMRQTALIVLLAHAGSFVPASRARIGVCDRIFTRIGASDRLARGQSTFMVEMIECARIAASAGPQSLILLDEVGRGTSTFDGLSIAWALAEHLVDAVGARTLFATHYHELAELADDRPRVRNFNLSARQWNGRLLFLRKLVPGAAAHSYGIEVARMAGLPAAVVARAEAVLRGLEAQRLRVTDDEAPRARPSQLSLFVPVAVPGTSDVADELARIDPDRLTPMEALETLQRLCAAARGRTGVRPPARTARSPRPARQATVAPTLDAAGGP